MRAQLGAGWPKSLLQGIINSGVSQGRLVFIKRRQLNAVAALQCYNWKADWDDVHQEGPAPWHQGGMGGQGCAVLPAQPDSDRATPCKRPAGRVPALPSLHAMDVKAQAWEGNRKKEGTCLRPADSQELAGCLSGSLGADCTVSLWVHGRDNSIAPTGMDQGVKALPLPGHHMGRVKGLVSSCGCPLGIWK